MKSLLIILSLAASALAANGSLVQRVPGEPDTRRNPFADNANATKAGAKLFARECAACHGARAQGIGKAPPLTGRDVQTAPDSALFWILRNGSLVRGMPPFAHLPEPERWQIVTFLRSLSPASKRAERKAGQPRYHESRGTYVQSGEPIRRKTTAGLMRLTSSLLFLSFTTLLLGAGDPIKSAFLSGSEIFVSDPGGKPRQLTHDGLPKSLLVWSPDGGKIAFTAEPSGGAVAEIGIVSLSGEPTRHIPFRVPQAGVDITGMHGVEELYWMDDHRLAVSGSFNPSTVEYVVIDIATGKEIASYGTDGFSLAVSPKGSHVAYESWVPHFQAEDERRPQFCLDHECDSGRFAPSTYPGVSRHVEFVGNPLWSPDGKEVAILAQCYPDFRLSLVIRPLVGAALEYPLPAGSPSESLLGYNEANQGRYQLAWDGKAVLLKAGDSVWRLDANSKRLMRSVRESDRIMIEEPFKMRDRERERVEAQGAEEVDFWCQSCPLSRLPRRHGPYENVVP